MPGITGQTQVEVISQLPAIKSYVAQSLTVSCVASLAAGSSIVINVRKLWSGRTAAVNTPLSLTLTAADIEGSGTTYIKKSTVDSPTTDRSETFQKGDFLSINYVTSGTINVSQLVVQLTQY